MKRNTMKTGVVLGVLLAGICAGFAEETSQVSSEETKAVAAEARVAKWHTSYADAKAEAEKEKLPILLLYTAPGWCGPCRMLDNNVLNSDAFQKFADKNLVLLKADCSEKENKEAWLKNNAEIAETFKLEYFPQMYFFKADKTKLGMIGGYEPEWDTPKYLVEMGKVINP